MKKLSLALQGGGALGAFTWGVLDRILQEDVELDLISGASAGAINAVLVAQGTARGGNSGAREHLSRFWTYLGQSNCSIITASFQSLASLGWQAVLKANPGMASPYRSNPFDINPLRSFLYETVDFESLKSQRSVRLMISATRIENGRVRLFDESEVSLDVLMASTCLPLLNHAVEIEGEYYWDGGLSSNPPLYQAALKSVAQDLLLVEIMPSNWQDVPQTNSGINKRLGQIAFSTALHVEKEALDGLMKVHNPNNLKLHRIAAEDTVEDLLDFNPIKVDWPQILRLKDAGKQAANGWIKENLYSSHQMLAA